MLTALLWLAIAAAGEIPAMAQVAGVSQQQYNRASVYRYADEDAVTIQVNVWGTVQNTGVYEVPKGIQLKELFSAAGGPSLSVSRRADDQTIILELVRAMQDGRRETVYKQVMDDQIVVSEENPVLQDGDVLTVESFIQRGVNWRDVLSIGSSLVTLAITVINFATS